MDQFQAMAMTGTIIIYTIQYKRAAMLCLAFNNIFIGKPDGLFDIRIQPGVLILFAEFTSKTEPDKSLLVKGMLPVIDADQVGRFEMPAGFFVGFTNSGLKKRLVILQMPGGLIDDQLTMNLFLDQQELLVGFDDRGNGQVWVPAHEDALDE